MDKEFLKDAYECTLGYKSNLNLLGKIVIIPILVIVVIFLYLMNLLFTKGD